jgi:hypothetical protein
LKEKRKGKNNINFNNIIMRFGLFFVPASAVKQEKSNYNQIIKGVKNIK